MHGRPGFLAHGPRPAGACLLSLADATRRASLLVSAPRIRGIAAIQGHGMVCTAIAAESDAIVGVEEAAALVILIAAVPLPAAALPCHVCGRSRWEVESRSTWVLHGSGGYRPRSGWVHRGQVCLVVHLRQARERRDPLGALHRAHRPLLGGPLISAFFLRLPVPHCMRQNGCNIAPRHRRNRAR